jgi:hypothetical protein
VGCQRERMAFSPKKFTAFETFWLHTLDLLKLNNLGGIGWSEIRHCVRSVYSLGM